MADLRGAGSGGSVSGVDAAVVNVSPAKRSAKSASAVEQRNDPRLLPQALKQRQAFMALKKGVKGGEV